MGGVILCLSLLLLLFGQLLFIFPHFFHQYHYINQEAFIMSNPQRNNPTDEKFFTFKRPYSYVLRSEHTRPESDEGAFTKFRR